MGRKKLLEFNQIALLQSALSLSLSLSLSHLLCLSVSLPLTSDCVWHLTSDIFSFFSPSAVLAHSSSPSISWNIPVIWQSDGIHIFIPPLCLPLLFPSFLFFSCSTPVPEYYYGWHCGWGSCVADLIGTVCGAGKRTWHSAESFSSCGSHFATSDNSSCAPGEAIRLQLPWWHPFLTSLWPHLYKHTALIYGTFQNREMPTSFQFSCTFGSSSCFTRRKKKMACWKPLGVIPKPRAHSCYSTSKVTGCLTNQIYDLLYRGWSRRMYAKACLFKVIWRGGYAVYMSSKQDLDVICWFICYWL